MSVTLPPTPNDAGVPRSTEPTSVYRYYDKFDLLIYVGITNRGMQRNREHNASKVWWPFVVRQEVDHHDTRLQALAAEKQLIWKYRPPFNKQHNPGHVELVDAYLGVMAQASAGSARELFQELEHKLPLSPIPSDDERYAMFRSDPAHGMLVTNLTRPDKMVVAHSEPQSYRYGRLHSIESHGPMIVVRVRLDGARIPIETYSAYLRLSLTSHKPPTYVVKTMNVVAEMVRKDAA